MIDKAYLAEAFKQLDLLNEEDYNLSTDSSAIEDAIDMLDKNDKIMSMDIIDDEADNEEELKDSYNGKVILDCCVCHSKLYKDKEDVIIDDETDLANVGEECPFCYTNDGYYVIGQVAPFNDEEPEVEETEEEVIETEEPVEEEEEIEESLNESDDEINKLKFLDTKELGELPRDFVYTNNGFFDLEKNLQSNQHIYGTWVGFEHKGSRVDTKMRKMLPDVVEDIALPAMARYLNVSENKIEVEDRRNSTDMFRLYYISGVNNESLDESIENATIDTEDETITMTSKEDGGVSVETSPKECCDDDEVLVPLEPEVEQEIEMNEPEQEIDDEVDVPIDDFDEETFDELGESFLKNTYDNVVSYKTESIKEQDGNRLVVEGLIKFNSGNTKKTTFIFEAKDITKTGRVRFIGENCQLSRGKKSFTVAGKVNEGKFISESLNYNYRAKDVNGKSARMYGTVRTNK